jgi:hypothetical protein
MANKLGKQPPRLDGRTLKLSKYMTAIPQIPDSFSWVDRDQVPSWGMMANDRYGDCVWAAFAHLVMGWTAGNGSLWIPSDDEVLQAYASTGFDPSTGQGDNGTNELDALNYMRSTGMAGHKIGAYVSLDTSNIQEIKTAIYLFGGILLGVSLPLSAEGEPNWDFPPDDGNTRDSTPGSWGGHGICGLGYDSTFINIITWGAPLPVDWSFWSQYMDEAYAIISPDFITGDKPAPNGFDMPTLINDLQSFAA